MELKMLEKLQNIVRDANQIRGLKAWYEANPHRDKCGPVFGVYFECLTGADPDAVGKAFLCALNTHRWLIFETMADYLMEEANSIRQSAELEIKEVQELLDSVKKEAEEPCTTE